MGLRLPIVLALFMCSPAYGQAPVRDKYAGSPVARAELDKAELASEADKWDEAVAHYKKAIELDPNFADAHEKYMFARGRAAMGDLNVYVKITRGVDGEEKKKLLERIEGSDKAVTREYEDLVEQHPGMAIYRWALGLRYHETNPELEEKYCKESIALDPGFGHGYSCIGAVASLRGDRAAAVQSYRKLAELEPDNKEAWRLLQSAASETDPQQYKAVTDEIVQKFSGTDTAVQALLTYSESLPNRERCVKLEEIVAKYPPKQFKGGSEAAGGLFALYDAGNPAKAASLAHNVLGELPSDKDWKRRVEYADAMANAQAKIDSNDAKGAAEILKDIKPPTSTFNRTRLELLKAQAQDKSGNTATAYAELLKVFAATPEHEMEGPLYQYGEKVGKNEAAVSKDVWTARVASSTPEIPFTLESFLDGRKISLADYKGKVVLLDFWYPNCSPCMRAMPYLQALYAKYKDSGLVFLGVNGYEEQAAFVTPLVKARGWGFIPLKGDKEFCEDVYKVHGFPSTFLIGGDGRVYFKPHTYDEHQQDIADMQIQALLAAANQDRNR